MRRVGRIALALTASLTCVAATGAEIRPSDAIRGLQALQDQIALGDTIAEAAHAKAIERTARLFTKAKPETWADARNARALVIYLFSGGSAPVIAAAVPESAVALELRPLYGGAIAYGLGDDDKARKALMPIDARALPGGLGGRLALVQAILCTDADRAKAIALLDVARLLEPGTLIEEAALRKELSLIGPNGDLDKFGMLARRYESAFARSVYAENFRQMLIATATQIGSADSKEAGLRLARVTLALGPSERRDVFLAIARESVLAGRTTMAAFAAGEAAKLATGSESSRAKVYLGAATIFGDSYSEGRNALAEVAPTRLDGRDRALRVSALAVAEMIRKPPVAARDGRIEAIQASVVDEGERAIARADDTMRKAAR